MEKYWAAHPDEVFSPCTSEVDGARALRALRALKSSQVFLPTARVLRGGMNSGVGEVKFKLPLRMDDLFLAIKGIHVLP